MFRSVSVLLTANSTTFVSQMRAAGASLDDFHRKAEMGAAKTEASAMKAHKALTGLAVVAATVLAVGLASSVKAAAEFEVALKNVATISDSVRDNFGAASKQVIDLSTRLPQSAKTLAEGLYEIASSGFQGADGMEVLAKSATAASAGLTSTNVAAKGISAVLNAYGKSAAEAGDVSDILFQTVNLGVVTFEELSMQLGDFVGTAAQLGVPIDEAASAFAAMTLSGVNAAEAATSLNGAMIAFIKPSEAMIAAAKTLGFESSVAMVQELGLKDSIELLGKSTGGSIEAIARLFNERRALRGVTALLAAEGENYRRTEEGIVDVTSRAGATQKALNIQMESASAQWKVFRNQIDAGRIALGTALLPVLVDTMRGMRELGSDALPTLRAGWEDVQSAWEKVLPFFEATGEVGANLIDIIGDLVDRFGPLAAALGSVAATAFVGALIAAAQALEALTGLVADNEMLATALAVAFGVKLVSSLIAAATAFGALKLEQAAVGLYNLVGAAEQGALALGAVNAVSLGGIIGITTLLITELKRGTDQAKALGVELKKNVGDLKAPDALQRISDEAARMAAEVEKGAEKMKLLGAVSGIDLNHTDKKLKAIADAAKSASEEANKLAIAFDENVNTVANATGLTAAEVKKLANTLGVDLTGAFGKSKDERQKLIDHVTKTKEELDALKAKAYGAGAGLSDAFGKSEEDILAAAEAADKFTASVTEAFNKGFDVLSNFADATKQHAQALEAEASAADKVASASDRVADAQQRAAEAQEGISEAHERAAEAQEQVIEAHDRVAESEQDLADLRVDVSERSAEAQEKYAERVEESNENILRAEEDLAEKRISLAEDVADAQRRIEEDRLEGQERINAAEQRIRDVQKRAADDARERRQRDQDRARLDAAKTPEERQRIQAEIDRRKSREDEQKAREQASKDLKDAQADLQKIREENAEKEKKNQEALAEAQKAQADGIKEAERAVTDARKEGLAVQKEGRELAKQAVEDEKQIAAAVKSVEDARRGVIDAQKNAADAESGIADAERDHAKASGEVTRAERDRTSALAEMNDAQEKVKATSLEGFFQNQIAEAKKFAEGIREAARQGLDPAYIAQLLQEGPEKAAPILDAIMQDQTGTLVRQMNQARDGLKTVQEQMVEAARVTQRAINTTNTDMAAEYGRAMEILAAKAALGGQATAQAIADKLQIGVGEVERIAKDYVIVLTKGINPMLEAIGARPVAMDQSESRTSAGIQQFAMGGRVPGQGDGDTVPAMLTPGEYVFSKPAVQNIGVENLEREHKRARRGYATGGFVYPDDVPVPPGQMDDFGSVLGYSGAMADQKMYYAVRDFVAKHPPNKGKGGGGSSAGGYGYQALIDFLKAKGVEHEVTSTQRDGSITSSGNLSLHATGQAADFWSNNMREIFDTFGTISSSLQELFYDPAGRSVKNGEWADFTVGGHEDHVHAATFAAGSGPGIPGVGGGGRGTGAATGELDDWIRDGLALAGKPASWHDGIRARAMQESSGDPNAINEWDSNYEAGTPSKGIMQMIDPTFQAHKVDGYDDIWNPVHNIAAASNYIASRYGDPYSLPAGGYAKGGLVDVLKNLPTFHAGGIVPGDKEVIARLEGGEGILSRQSMALGSPLGTYINQTISSALSRHGIGGGTSTAVMPDLSGLAAQIGEQVASAIAKAGIKVEANGRQIGDVVAEEFRRRGKR